MTVGALKAILAPLHDEASVFLDTEDSADFTLLAAAEVDEQGDLILSDYEEEEDAEEIDLEDEDEEEDAIE